MPMYCPNCSTPAIEGAKFCKACGLNLAAVTQALSGEVAVSEPLLDREYKRARRSVSEGIQGAAVGAALLVSAVMIYLLPSAWKGYYDVASMALALSGVIKLFRGIGRIVDAKVGASILGGRARSVGTGRLAAPAPATRGLAPRPEVNQLPTSGREQTEQPQINREGSVPLREIQDEIMSKLRN